MRHVDRNAVPMPATLLHPRVEREHAAILEVLSLPEEKREQVRAPIVANVYRQALDQLRSLFHGKCCYCESPLAPTQRGELDHLRPKQAAAQLDNRASVHHYVWLAYEWRNLYLVCQECNRTKRNLFPVRGERAPLGMPIEQIYQTEQGTIIDPCVDFPHQHFAFDWTGTCSALDERAAASIEVCGLNRPGLVMARAQRFIELRETLGELAPSNRGQAMRAAQRGGQSSIIADLAEMIGPAAPYSGAARIVLFEVIDRLGKTSGLSIRFDDLHDQLRDVLPRIPAQRLQEAYAAPIARRARDRDRERDRERDHERDTARDRARDRALRKLSNRPAATLRLARVKLTNFRAIEHLELEIAETSADVEGAPCLALLGENATGKTSVLEAIALGVLGTAGVERLGIEPLAFLRRPEGGPWESPTDLPLAVEIGFHGLDEPLRLELAPTEARFRGPRGPAAVLLAYGPWRYFPEKHQRRFDDPWRRVISLFNPMATIAHPGRWLGQADTRTFAAAVRALREILMLKTEDDLVRGDNGEVQIRAHGLLMPLERLSQGYRAMLSMAVDVMREMLSHWDGLEQARGLVLIDEIETHLHPRWKMRVMRALRRAMPQVQFIVTTHDPLCLRGTTDGEIFVLQRNSDNKIEQLTDLPSVKGMRAEQLLTSEFFGLGTTDPDTEAKLSLYTELLARREQLTAQEEDELASVRKTLEKDLVIGDTLAEQAAAEALGRHVAAARVDPVRRAIPRRRQIIDDVLAALGDDAAEDGGEAQ